MTRGEIIAWLCAAVGLVAAAIGWLADPAVFASAWLAALSAWLLWPLGALALVMAHSLTGGRWGEAVRPGLLLGIGTLPLVVVALIPVLVLLPQLYHWARPDALGHVKNGFWLNPHFFLARMVGYVVIWLGLALLVPGRLRRHGTLGNLAAPGLILLALTFTFACVDLTLSIEDFNSNIYGMMRATSAALLALSIAVLATPWVTREVRADLAKLLLALVVLWTYLDFMQLLIVWQSNLGTDAGWYVHRTTPYWGAVAIIIEVFRFVVPFLILVIPGWQRNRFAVDVVCLLLIGTTVLRDWWLVLPAYDRGIGIIDVAAMLGLGGLSAGWAYRMARRVADRAEAVGHV